MLVKCPNIFRDLLVVLLKNESLHCLTNSGVEPGSVQPRDDAEECGGQRAAVQQFAEPGVCGVLRLRGAAPPGPHQATRQAGHPAAAAGTVSRWVSLT